MQCLEELSSARTKQNNWFWIRALITNLSQQIFETKRWVCNQIPKRLERPKIKMSEITVPTMKDKINWIMAKFLGVEKKASTGMAIFIFLLWSIWLPVNVILGSIVIGDCSSQPKLPWIMVSMGVIEAFWILLLFYLYVFIPRKESKSGSLEISEGMYSIYSGIIVVLTIGMVILIILQQVYILTLSKEDIDRECKTSDDLQCKNCSSIVWYGCWVGLPFKYLNVFKFVLCLSFYYNRRCHKHLEK